MLRKFPLEKINGIKNAPFFLSRAPTRQRIFFNLQFSKAVCGISHFRFRFIFIKVDNFLPQNAWTL